MGFRGCSLDLVQDDTCHAELVSASYAKGIISWNRKLGSKTR
jgi:hypothetical protein